MAVWSLQLFLYTGSIKGPLPSRPWNIGSGVWASLMCIALLAASVCLVFQKKAHWVMVVLGVLIFLRVLVYVPGIVQNARNVDDWTYASELLAICAASLVLAGAPTGRGECRYREAAWRRAAKAGRILFAATLIVFGIEHFLYARDVGTMIPTWIPWHLFWAYFVGVAFIAASSSIIAMRCQNLAAILLGVMFFLWVVLLWVPAVGVAPRDGFQWTNAFITLAMSGGAFALVAVPKGESRW